MNTERFTHFGPYPLPMPMAGVLSGNLAFSDPVNNSLFGFTWVSVIVHVFISRTPSSETAHITLRVKDSHDGVTFSHVPSNRIETVHPTPSHDEVISVSFEPTHKWWQLALLNETQQPLSGGTVEWWGRRRVVVDTDDFSQPMFGRMHLVGEADCSHA